MLRMTLVLLASPALHALILGPIPAVWINDPEHLSAPVAEYRVPYGEATAANASELAHLLAPRLAQFSADNGTEACARFCKTPQGNIRATLITANSHLFCVAPAAMCAPNELPKETIHSHPPQHVFCANAVDALLVEDPVKEGACGFAGDPDSFSPTDQRVDKAWLVGSRGQILYWHAPPAPIPIP